MKWPDVEQLMEQMCLRLAHGLEHPLAPTATAQTPEVERAADAWLQRWLRELTADSALTPDLRRNLYARFAYAKQFAATASFARIPLAAASEAGLRELYEEMLIGSWHHQSRKHWLTNPSWN